MIVREDTDLPRGRLASKTGQAFIGCFAKAPPEIQDRYLADGEGMQVVLSVPDEVALRQALACAQDVAPVALVSPDGTLIAFGFGPITRAAARSVTKGLACMK